MPSPSVSTFTFPSTTEPVFSASTSEPAFESPNHSQTSQTTQSQQLQQYHTTTVSNNNPKFPYLKKEEYEDVGMKMETGKRQDEIPKGIIMSLPPDFCLKNNLLIFGWLSKAQIGGYDESKENEEINAKQGFHNLRVLIRGVCIRAYDRFSEDIEVAITLKTKGGLDYLSFDDLYNKLRTLEIDVKGGSSYDSRGTSAPTHSALILLLALNSNFIFLDNLIQPFTSVLQSLLAFSTCD
ncbi:hypothetical protein Tco_1038125 [Tanacetum coccineum]